MKVLNFSVSIIVVLAVFIGCTKIEHISPIPHIAFKSFTVFDSLNSDLQTQFKAGKLIFSFEDGDGDVGLSASDTTTDLFFTLYRIKNGITAPAPPDDPLFPSSYRIPYMVRLGQNKILKGSISVTILYLFYSNEDTIKYDFYITDRALNKSNVASTSDIALGVNNTYRK